MIAIELPAARFDRRAKKLLNSFKRDMCELVTARLQQNDDGRKVFSLEDVQQAASWALEVKVADDTVQLPSDFSTGEGGDAPSMTMSEFRDAIRSSR